MFLFFLVIHFAQVKVIQRKPFTTETQRTQRNSKKSGTLCALCVSSERNERVVKRIINPDNSYWSEVDNQIYQLVNLIQEDNTYSNIRGREQGLASLMPGMRDATALKPKRTGLFRGR